MGVRGRQDRRGRTWGRPPRLAVVALLLSAGVLWGPAHGDAGILAPGRSLHSAPLHPGRQPANGQITAHDGSFWLDGNPIVLRGLKKGVGQNDVERFASWGVNFIRLRMAWAELE